VGRLGSLGTGLNAAQDSEKQQKLPVKSRMVAKGVWAMPLLLRKAIVL
jgi:hypothetical protein